MAAFSSLIRGNEDDNSIIYWSQLPTDILRLIAARIVRISDFIRFRSVCRQWRSAGDPKLLRPQPPLLLLNRLSKTGRCSFYSISTDSYHYFHLPEIADQLIISAAHGWLVLEELQSRARIISLLNPITGAMIRLPPTSFGISKVVLTSSPAADDCVVIAFHNFKSFSLCRPGVRKEWTRTETDYLGCVRGAVHHNGRLLFSDMEGIVYPIDFDTQPEEIKWVKENPQPMFDRYDCLMKVGDKMFLIRKKCYQFHVRYTVYESNLNHESQPTKWVETKSMGDFALFVSVDHEIVALSLKEFPELRKDCIYYASGCCGCCRKRRRKKCLDFEFHKCCRGSSKKRSETGDYHNIHIKGSKGGRRDQFDFIKDFYGFGVQVLWVSFSLF